MAFTNLSTELEELINKCEFENKQYVRAINQEKQLFASLENEIELKMGEMGRLGTAMGEMDQETKRYDRQIILNKDNSENLKKTNDVLTEHVHAMKTKFDNIKSRRKEEKNTHNQQLQHFTDVWMRYKEKYESFPLAVQLKQLQTQIQEVEKNKEKSIQDTKEMKEATQQVENSMFWKSMDWKTYIIKLSENRVQTLKLKKEIEETKDLITSLKIPQHIEMDVQANDPCEENNVQKMSQMQINGYEVPSQDNSMWDMEMSSPRIRHGNRESNMEISTQNMSVPSEVDEDNVEFMQTDQFHDIERRDTVEATEITSQQLQQQDNVASLSFQHKVVDHNLHVSTQYQPIQTHAELHQSRDTSNKERRSPLPCEVYKKTGQMDGICDAENSQSMQHSANRSFKIHQKDNKQYENRLNVHNTNSKPSLRNTSYINTNSQKNTCIPKPQLNKMPFKPIQAPKSLSFSPRLPFQMSAPTLSHQTGNGIRKSVNQGTFQSPNIQPPNLLINRSTNRSMQITVPKAQTPNITHSGPKLMQTHAVTCRAVKPIPNNLRVNKVGNFGQDQLQMVQGVPSNLNQMVQGVPSNLNQTVQGVPSNHSQMVQGVPSNHSQTVQGVPSNHSQMELKNSERIQTDMRVSDKPADKLSRPEMLKIKNPEAVKPFIPQPSPQLPVSVQNTEAVKPFIPQPSPQPPVSVQNTEMSNRKPTTNDPKKCKMPIQQNVPEVAIPNQNQPGNVYGLKNVKKHSPFSLEKHHHMLQELKKSPGYEQYNTGRRMFQKESNQSKGMFGGGDSSDVHSAGKSPINTAVLVGAKQPAGDNIYTATPLEPTAATVQINLFSFNNSPGVDESGNMFMEEHKETTTTDGFQFTFGSNDTKESPSNALSMFDNTDPDKSDFSFNIEGGITEDSGNSKNVMSLFGDSSPNQNGTSPSSFSFGLKRTDIDDSDQGGNVLSLFGESTENTEHEGSANKDFSFTFGEKGDGKDGIFSLFGGKQDVEEKPFTFNFG